jgi:acyl-CoA thioesterase I
MRSLMLVAMLLCTFGCKSLGCKSASASEAGRDYKKPAKPAKGITPAPLLSRGKSVDSNLIASSPDKLTDGTYKDGAWAAKMPSADKPAWVEIDIGQGPEKLLLAWTASGSFNHLETQYGGPGSYRIEVSPDGKAWKSVVTVTDNLYRTRAHGFDFTGNRFVRWVVTGPSKDTYQYGIQPDELDIHDISSGAEDTWFFLGDSITAMSFNRSPSTQPSFAELIAKKHPGYFPMMLNGGQGFEKSGDGLQRLPLLLKQHPEVKYWAIGYGTNDSAGSNPDTSDFAKNLEAMVAMLKAAGRVPIIARIPYAPKEHDTVPQFNAVIDAVTKKNALTPGPDLYAHFKAHVDELEDGLHPNTKGAVSINRLWAAAVDGLY